MSHFSFPVTRMSAFKDILTSAFADIGAALVAGAMPTPPAPKTITAATANMSDDGTKMYVMNSGSAQTLTIVQNLSSIAVGETITVVVRGAGAVTIAQGSGTTVNCKVKATLVSDGRYSVIRIAKSNTNEYTVTGDLVPAT